MKYNSEAIHDSFSEFKFCHSVNLRRTGSFIRLTYFQIEEKKPNFLSQYKRYFFSACHINFGMKRSAWWWITTQRRFMIPSRNLDIVMPLIWGVQVHYSEQ